MDQHELLQTLLQQARVLLAQGQPTKALNCVLAAVRQQRGEAGVFAVLNETREAHGLQRLAVPQTGHQLEPGAEAPRLHAAAASHHSHSHPRLRHSHHHATAMDDTMMDDDGPSSGFHGSSGGAHSHGSTGELDPTEAVETLFRRLGVHNHQPVAAPRAAPFGFSSAASSSLPSASSLLAHHAMLNSHGSHAHPSHNFGAPNSHGYPSASASTGAAAPSHATPSIHYPSMRTFLPSLSSSSSAMLEEMHEPRYSASAVGELVDPDTATPLLSLAGREDVLDAAYDSQSSVICPQCAALIPRARFAAHLQYWCQVDT